METVRQYVSRQRTDRKGPETAKTAQRATVEMLPTLIDNAPRDFVACGGSFERLRKQYGITRQRALELVALGIIRSMRGQTFRRAA